jgi:hypothetical protein
MRIAAVRCFYDVNILTIHFINKKKDKIRGRTKVSVQSSERICYVTYHDSCDEKMEMVLAGR